MENRRTYILLVEGKTDTILYKTLIEKSIGCREYDIEYLHYNIRMLLSKIMIHRRDLMVLEIQNNLLIIINCKGYDRLKNYLKELIDSDYFIESIHNGLSGIIVATDKDRVPMDSIYGVLASLKYRVFRDNHSFKIDAVEKEYFPIYIIEQGLDSGVKAIEDELDLLAEQLYPDMTKAINAVEEIIKTKLSPIQRLGIIEAIKVNNNGLYALIPKLVRDASLEELRNKLYNQFHLLDILTQT